MCRVVLRALSLCSALLLACTIVPPANAEQSAKVATLVQTKRSATPVGGREENGLRQTLNNSTIGLAAGQLEGAPLRFATELARVLDDGENMRVVPLVTRGPTDNIFDLLYLRGVDTAIVYGDVLEHFRTNPETRGLESRINYIMPLFPSEVHVLVRPEIEKLED